MQSKQANEFVSLLSANRLIAVVRLPTYERAVPLSKALFAGGVRLVELTFTGLGTAKAISQLRRAFGDELFVGAGTVLDPRQSAEATAAGAQFIVTPATRPSVVEFCNTKSIPCICGAFTATEVASTLDEGCDLIKLFPARVGGPSYIRDLRGPFPAARFIPTGGVTNDNARAYLAAGAIAVGMGASLVSAQDVTTRDWTEIERRARLAAAAVLGVG